MPPADTKETNLAQCYAKTIGLSAEKEPEIFNAIKFGSVLENVVFNQDSREVNYDDSTLTENTRWYGLPHQPCKRAPL